MISIVSGLLLVSLGLWGLFDEYYYVMDLLRGALPLLLMLGGAVAVLAGSVPHGKEEEADV